MKHNVILTITSLLSILFVTFHLADDIVRGFEPGGFSLVLSARGLWGLRRGPE